MEKHKEEANYQYIKVFSNPKGSIYISLDAIRASILNYLGEKPTEEVKFIEGTNSDERVKVERIKEKIIITAKLAIHVKANINNNVLLVQEKIRTAIIEDTNLSPYSINVEIVSNYGDKNESKNNYRKKEKKD